MTILTISRITVLALVAAVTLLTACSKQQEPAGHGADDGHGHGKAASETEAPSGKKMCVEHNVPLEECGICRPVPTRNSIRMGSVEFPAGRRQIVDQR